MPARNRPPKAFWDAAILAVKGSHTARDPEAVVADLWYNKMSYAQRRKWTAGRNSDITPAERTDIEAMAKQERAAGIAEKLMDHPEILAMMSGGLAGLLVPDVGKHIMDGAATAWSNFWASIGSGLLGRGGPPTIGPGTILGGPIGGVLTGELKPGPIIQAPIGPTLPPRYRSLLELLPRQKV